MDTNSLIALRDKILNDVMPLVVETSEAGADQFGLLLRVVQTGNAPQEVYARAYAAANAIENKDEKLNALMLLLDEVELDINKDDDSRETPEADTQSRPEEPHADSDQERRSDENQY